MSDIDKKLQVLDQIRTRLQRTGAAPQYERHGSPDKKSFDFRMLSSQTDMGSIPVWHLFLFFSLYIYFVLLNLFHLFYIIEMK